MVNKKAAVIYSMIVIFICFLPYIQPGLISGSDSPYHLYRIYSLADALKNGVFPVKVHPTMAYGYGYGTGFFYSDVLLYFPAILILLGVSLATAYKCFALVIFIGLYSSMYFCMRKTSRSMEASLLAATLYVTSNVIIGGFYQDFRMGEMTGLIFMPIAVVGCYLFLKKEVNPIMMIIGFIGLLYTHAISGLLGAIICVFILVFSIPEIIKKTSKIIYLILSATLALLATASYWLPMWQQFRAIRFKVSAPWTTEEQNVEGISTNLGIRGIGLPLITVFIILFVFVIIISIFSKINRSAEPVEAVGSSNTDSSYEFGVFSAILASCLIVVTSSYQFWHFLNSHGIHLIQFPNRMYGPITILICIAIAVFSDKVIYFCVSTFKTSSSISKREPKVQGKHKHKAVTVTAVLTLVLTCSVLCSLYNYSDYFKSSTNDVINEVESGKIAGLGAGEEWLSLETDRSMLATPETAYDNEGNSVTGTKSGGDASFTFVADLSKQYYVVPFVFYRGYRVIDEAGNHYDVTSNNGTGLLQVMMHGNDGNYSNKNMGTIKLTVSFEGTSILKLSYFASIIGIIAVIIFGLYWKNRSTENVS